MTTTHNPDGTVTVTTTGHRRLSELRDTAALAFAEDRQTAVDWPDLVTTSELDPHTYAATFAMRGGTQLALSCPAPHPPTCVT